MQKRQLLVHKVDDEIDRVALTLDYSSRVVDLLREALAAVKAPGEDGGVYFSAAALELVERMLVHELRGVSLDEARADIRGFLLAHQRERLVADLDAQIAAASKD